MTTGMEANDEDEQAARAEEAEQLRRSRKQRQKKLQRPSRKPASTEFVRPERPKHVVSWLIELVKAETNLQPDGTSE